MKKIIAAFDGLRYSKGTRDYALLIAKQANTHLVGVFLDDPLYTSYKVYDMVVKQGATEKTLRELDAKDQDTRREAAEDFEKACREHKLQFSVHHDRKLPLRELKHESVYADLMVIDLHETLSHHKEEIPTRFVRDLLADVQCPVLLVPGEYKPLDKLVLLFDGEPSSVHAIKMFSYLLPNLKYLDVEVVTVNPMGAGIHLPDNKLMKEFMKRHFPNASYTVLTGLPEFEIAGHLRQAKENNLVVLGAYRRNAVSRWFRESMADYLMKESVAPLFIAHN
jgi:nucleotide-binding universal stress UspA family protein